MNSGILAASALVLAGCLGGAHHQLYPALSSVYRTEQISCIVSAKKATSDPHVGKKMSEECIEDVRSRWEPVWEAME